MELVRVSGAHVLSPHSLCTVTTWSPSAQICPQADICWKPAQRWQHRARLTGGCHEPTVAKGKWGFSGHWVLNLHSYFYIETFPSCTRQWAVGPGPRDSSWCFPFWGNVISSVFLERWQCDDSWHSRSPGGISAFSWHLGRMTPF